MNPLSVHQLSALLTVYRSPSCQLYTYKLTKGHTIVIPEGRRLRHSKKVKIKEGK